jgi:hypothetical protein
VHDALIKITKAVDADAKLPCVVPQRLDLGPRYWVGDRAVDIQRRRVVVLGRQCQIGTAYLPTGLAQSVESLRAGHLVNEVKINKEQVGLTFGGPYHVVVPHLLAQCLAHDD